MVEIYNFFIDVKQRIFKELNNFFRKMYGQLCQKVSLLFFYFSASDDNFNFL